MVAGETRTLVLIVIGFAISAAVLAWSRGGGDGDDGPAPVVEERGRENRRENVATGQRQAVEQQPDPATENEKHPLLRRVAGRVLRCIDAETNAPFAGVRGWDSENSREVGTSDTKGALKLGPVAAGKLLLFGEECFVMPLPPDVALKVAAGEAAEVRVWRDRFTLAVDVETEWPDTTPSGPILLRLSQTSAGFPTARLGGNARIAPELRAAWRQHTLLVPQIRWAGLAWHISRGFSGHDLPATGGQIRFNQPGTFDMSARLPDGLVAKEQFTVTARGPNRVKLRFRLGQTFRVHVLDKLGRPIEEAQADLWFTGADGMSGGERATTGIDGRATWKGLWHGESAVLELNARGYRSHKSNVVLDGQTKEVRLQPLAVREHPIRVHEFGSGKPLAGVAATLGRESATTNASGLALVKILEGSEPVLTLMGNGYLAYREMLRTTEPLPTRFELIPAKLDRQLLVGAIAVIEGLVRDGSGKPVEGATVTMGPWVDSKGNIGKDSMSPFGMVAVAPGTKATRMPLAGHRPDTKSMVTTGPTGRFVLTSTSRGRALVQTLGAAGKKREVFLVLGKRIKVQL